MSVRDDAISAHGGGELVDLKAQAAERAAMAAHAAKLAAVTLNARDVADLEMLATGAFSPLTGFMGEADYVRSRDEMRLASGVPWSIPITHGVDEAKAKSLKTGTELALATEDGKRLAILRLAEIYKVDRKNEAQNVFGTAEDAHPGAKNVTSMPPFCLAGKVTLVEEIPGRTFLEYPREPRQTRAAFRERGWKKIVAFQTRNPTHRAHEYIQKAALEICDGLMIHPLVGETKGDDVPAATRVRCYEVLLDRYFPKDRALLSVFPFAMRYAGPREALLHAIARQNYGFSHFIVGRDHAGVGNYYGTYDAQRIFDTLAPGELAIQTLFFEHSFWCRGCQGVASIKTCVHDEKERLILSGTRVRELLTKGDAPPAEYSRPEVAAILIEAYRQAASKQV